MKFDSEDQKKLLVKLLKTVPIQTTLGELFGGKPIEIADDVVALVKAIDNGEVQADALQE